MQLEEVNKLIDKFTATGLSKLEIEQDGFRLNLEKTVNVVNTASVSGTLAPVYAEPAKTAEEPAIETGSFILSPVVGTFYAAASPEEAPFVTVGKEVKKSDTVCLIEAMKMMSDVNAPADLVIEEILVSDGDTVGYNTPLFKYREI